MSLAAEPAARPPPRYRDVLRVRNFRNLLVAGLLSASGSAIAEICLVWIVYRRTGSGLDVGLLGAVGVAASVLLAVVGGTLADRHRRQRLMVTSDLARALTVGALATALFLGIFSLPAILVAQFVVAGFGVVFQPASNAILPSVVPAEHIANANGLSSSAGSIVLFGATSIGGVLIVAVGPIAGLFYNTVTFVASALLVGAMAIPAPSGAPTRREPFFAEVREGVRWLRRELGLLQLTISAGLFNFFQTIIYTFFVVYATVALHGTAVEFALLLGLNFAGQGLGGLSVGRLRTVRYTGRIWVVGYGVLTGVGALLLGLFPTLGLALPVVFAMGFLGGIAGVSWMTYAQLYVPAEMQGRYFGIDGLGSWAVLPLGQLGGGLILAAIGVTTMYELAGILWTVTGLLFLLPRSLARLGIRDAPTVAGG